MTRPLFNGSRPHTPFGKARARKEAPGRPDTAQTLRQRIQQKIDRYERDAARLSIRGERVKADALVRSALILRSLRRPPGR